MSNGKITDTAAKAELRARAEALVAENSAPLPDQGDDDARLVEAERRHRVSRECRQALCHEFASVLEDEDEVIWATEKVLWDVIEQTDPRTLAGIAAKLRTHLWHEDLEDDPSLRQVMACIERLVDAGQR